MTGVVREPRRCAGCGYRFTPARADQRYCGSICAGRAALVQVHNAVTRFAAGTGNGGQS